MVNTNNTDIIQDCQQYIAVELPSNLWAKSVDCFEKKFAIVFVTLQLMSVSLYG